jgi:transmembrane sensor
MELQRQIDRLIAHRASEWHQILETASQTERAAFVAWLKQSPLHVKEYLEAAYTDQVLKHLDAQREIDLERELASIRPTVVPFSQTCSEPAVRPRRHLGWKAALAAASVICLAALLHIYERARVDAFSTGIGEQRTIELNDTSLVTLNADSRIQVRLDKMNRQIELLRGEALFRVAHDAKRPFKVQTRSALVEAIGTQFNVYDRPEGTRVSVLEGRVRVQTPRQTRSLGAGEEVQVRADGSIEHEVDADVRNAVAWSERRLIFNDAPLEEMVREFNRYNPALQLRLQDVPPGSHHYNGIFDAADPESLAELLARERDLILERREGEIVIRSR